MSLIDIIYVLKWWTTFLVVGLAFAPLTFSIFKNFKDKGYIFSKIIGVAIISYFIFITGTLKILKFTQSSIILCLILLFIANYVIFIIRKEHLLPIFKKTIKLFLFEELMFLIALFLWSFVRSNNPDIHGLEKFMDFGFINSILRADYFPPKDMWYTPLSINYYYFGHLMTAILTKISSIPSFVSYNLMLATLFALTFTASFSLGMNFFDLGKFFKKSLLAGFISAILVSLGGNLTTIYAFFKAYVPADSPVPFWQLPFLPFSFPNNYWYPNATRFIYHTIHEFPLYSFVVSDLHGHVLDIPLVLLAIGLIFSFIIDKKVSIPNLIFLSLVFSIMYMTNAWDGLIYLLLTFLFLIIFSFYKNYNKWVFSYNNAYEFFWKLLTVCLGFFIFSLPFNIFFKPFVSGIGIICAPKFLTDIGKIGPFLFEAGNCQRSPIWQLMFLYGFFYFFVIMFILFLKFKKNYKLSKSDVFILLLIALSTILIIIPELVYVKDIYPTYYRANTMFKLVYEAFIMLSLSSAFIFIKLLFSIKRKQLLIPFLVVSMFLLSLVLIYPVFAINSYYRDLKTYQGLNGITYLSSLYPGDYNLINWINKYVTGQPVILEANGDSYTDYARISANTGLPTVIGWPVHEWLWRGTYDVVGPRVSDVQTLYTVQNIDTVKKLIKEYKIVYVVVSKLEWQKYPNLNERNFIKLGKLIYQNKEARLYKINP